MAESSHPKIAKPDHQILDVIRDRWSPRAFDAARPVDPGDLRRLFEAARWAPSSANEQPWRFVVADRRVAPEAFAALLASLTLKNQAWAAAAPLLVLVAIRMTHEATGGANAAAWYDAGQGVAFLTLQATSVGLSARQMLGFSVDAARSACDVPEPFEPGIVIAVGYAGTPDALTSDAHRQSELQPRSRRPLGEFVFEGRWGKTLL